MTRVHHTGKPGIIRRCWREAARPLRAPAAESGVGSLVLRLPVQAEDGIRRVGGVCPGTLPTCSRPGLSRCVLWIGVGAALLGVQEQSFTSPTRAISLSRFV